VGFSVAPALDTEDVRHVNARTATQDSVAVREQLERVTRSDLFVRSARLRALLEFLVGRVLAGVDEAAKEYTIGVEVYGRTPSYDPRTDPIVRVEMRQLRLKLSAYYSTAGQHDPVLIDVPKGQYRAVITPRGPIDAPPRESGGTSVTPPPLPDPPAHTRRRAPRIAMVLVTLVAVLVASHGRGPAEPADVDRLAVPHLPSVAVLPFETLGSDPRLAYFATGLADELIATLARVKGLHVAGRMSSFAVRAANARDAGQRLGVDAIVEGSARYESGRLRVVARLTRTSDGFQLWSDAFESTDVRVLDVQADIAEAVAGVLRLRVDPTARQPFVMRANNDPEAQSLYFQARQLAASRRAPDLERSIPLFEEAIARDEGYAMAYAGLADALGVLAYNGGRPPGEGLARSRAAAIRALELDPTLGEAAAQLASLTAFVDWNWADADRQFGRAIALAPSHPRAHAWYGQALVVQRRFEPALDALLTAQRLDPLTPSVTYAVGEAYLHWGRYEETIVQARRLLELDERSWGGHNLLARAFLALGRHDELLQALARSRGELWADVFSLIASGDPAGGRQLLHQRHTELVPHQPFTVASLYGAVGDVDAALYWLRRALRDRQVDIASATVEPTLARVREDLRFLEIADAIGLKDALRRPGSAR
jgi:TolB-like protein/tetratricopeptide (TPR) repeat protein